MLGKYNHGKSTLLNALVGSDHFKVADKRETVAISEYEHDGVVWVDTPGLDADPTKIDDRQAQNAALQIADFLFLVHQVTAGELDRHEIKAFRKLARQDRNYRKKMALVLTQVDQFEAGEVSRVERQCQAQLQDHLDLRELDIMSVSVVRYQNRNPELRKRSGMDCVLAKVEQVRADVSALRRREWFRLTSTVRNDLAERQQAIQSELNAARYRRDNHSSRLHSVVTKFVRQLREG